jgi:hypothetical protein
VRASPCDVATENPAPARTTRCTLHGIAHCTPARAHSVFSISMMSSDELSQNRWPSFFSG